MNAATVGKRFSLGGMGISAATWVAVALVTAGLWLGVTAHRGWMILAALGAFGPGVLRQLGLLDDFDELQKAAAAKAGLHAYLATGVALFTALIGQTWGRLDLGTDMVPASLVSAPPTMLWFIACPSRGDSNQKYSSVCPPSSS